MGIVIEFPRTRNNGAPAPLSAISDALGRIMQSDGDWFAVENCTQWIMDRAGIAVLSIEKFLCNGVTLTLRWWNDNRHDYDEQFRCILRLSRETVESVFDTRAVQLSPAAITEVQDTLIAAERALAAGTVARIVN